MFPQDCSSPSTWGRFMRMLGLCAECESEDVEIVGYWGPDQSRRLCATCDHNVWNALVREVDDARRP